MKIRLSLRKIDAKASYSLAGLFAGIGLCAGTACAPHSPVIKGGVLAVTPKQILESQERGSDMPLSTFDKGEVPLTGKRVHLVGKVSFPGAGPAGEPLMEIDGAGGKLLLRLPGPLDRPDALAPESEWELLARLDPPVTLGDGRRAFPVAPDVVVKTPGGPAFEKPSDTVVRVAAAEDFGSPNLPSWERTSPIETIKVRPDPATRMKLEFVTPGASGLQYAEGAEGKRFFDYRFVRSADDGRKKTWRCVFREDDGRLRNIGFGFAIAGPDDQPLQDRWIPIEGGQIVDPLLATRKDRPQNTYADVCLGIALAGFPFREASLVRFFLASEYNPSVAVYAANEGEEILEIAGRSERTYRIRVGFDVRRSAAEVDVPQNIRRYVEGAAESWYDGDVYFWLRAEEPHWALRYAGRLGPPGAPPAIVDLVQVPKARSQAGK
jgi:hypothetical protein